MGAGARIVRAVGAVLGVQAVAAFVTLLILNSYRRGAAGWLLPLVGAADLAVTVQIGWLAAREIALTRGRTAAAAWTGRVLAVLVIAGVAAGGPAAWRHLHRPAEGAFGTPVRDGGLTFTASPPRCGTAIKGVRAGNGAFCQVRLVATNTGTAPLVLDATAQRLDGSRGGHAGAMLFAGGRPGPRTRAFARPLPAAASFEGVLAFDVPNGFRPEALELHAGEGSEGVRIPVG